MKKDNKTSFIPKESLQNSLDYKAKGYKGLKHTKTLGFRVVILIFITTLLVCGAVFVYTGMLVEKIKTQENTLEELHRDFETSTVQVFVRKEYRVRHVTSLLESHLAPSHLFTQLERTTVQDVSFEKFYYRQLHKKDALEVSVTGVAEDFESVAHQMEQFRKYNALNAPYLSLLEFTEDGQVRFGVIFALDVDHILYTKRFSFLRDVTTHAYLVTT